MDVMNAAPLHLPLDRATCVNDRELSVTLHDNLVSGIESGSDSGNEEYRQKNSNQNRHGKIQSECFGKRKSRVSVPDSPELKSCPAIAAENHSDQRQPVTSTVTMTSETQKQSPDVPNRQRSSRRRRLLFSGTGLGILILALLPAIIAATPLRNTIANRALATRELEASIGSASAGWLSPVFAESAELARTDGSLRLRVPQAETQFSVIDLLSASPDLGTIRLDRPFLDVTVAPPNESFDEGAERQRSPGRATLTAEIHRAEVIVRTPQSTKPLIHVDNLTTTLRLESTPSGRQFVAQPTLLMDRVTLTPEACRQGLQFVAPLLADSATVTGEFSLDVSEFRFPVDAPDREARAKATAIAGRVTLHRVETGLRNPLLAQIADLVARLTGGQRAQLVQVFEDTVVDFEYRDGGVYHEGLAIVLPELSRDLVIRTSGRVGLDEQIDLAVFVSLPPDSTRSVPVVRRLTETPLEFRLTGTLDNPQLNFPEGRDLLDELAGRLLDPADGSQPATVEDAVGNLLNGLTADPKGKPDVEKTTSGILNLIQAIRGDKQKKKSPQPPPQ
jgi:hypothetical protein